MIDMHSHLIWGLDDGADNITVSQQMLRSMEKQGITTVVATPHVQPGHHDFPADDFIDRVRELNVYAEEQKWKIRAMTGSEILYTESVVDYLDAGEIPTMGLTNYVLVEFYPREEFKRIYDGLRKLANAGYPPILSHVERYECLRKDDPKIRDLKAFDVKFQVNAGTAIRCLEPLGDRFIRKLIRNGHVDYIASDAHNAGTRPVLMRKAYTEVEKKYGKETADRLFLNNQKKDFLIGRSEKTDQDD